MLKMFSRAMLALLLATGAALPAQAQDIEPSAAFEQRAQELASIINGAGDMQNGRATTCCDLYPKRGDHFRYRWVPEQTARVRRA